MWCVRDLVVSPTERDFNATSVMDSLGVGALALLLQFGD